MSPMMRRMQSSVTTKHDFINHQDIEFNSDLSSDILKVGISCGSASLKPLLTDLHPAKISAHAKVLEKNNSEGLG